LKKRLTINLTYNWDRMRSHFKEVKIRDSRQGRDPASVPPQNVTNTMV
jgi:hypothetical protein